MILANEKHRVAFSFRPYASSALVCGDAGCAGCVRCAEVSLARRAIMACLRQPFLSRPLTARECADYMGFTPAWIRKAINEGVTVRGHVVKLEAETLSVNGRTTHRIHEHSFNQFLVAIGWKHLPRVGPAPHELRDGHPGIQ